MNPLPCFGKYDNLKFMCRCLCRSTKCIRETKRKKQSQQEYDECLVGTIGGALRGAPLSIGESRRDPLGDRDVQDCFGRYDDSIACSYCKHKMACFFRKHDASSSSVFYPTGSSAVDTGATQVEGVSNMTDKDLATRKEKAQELEVVSVGNDFMVKSSKRQGGYMVTVKEEGGHHCACMDYATHRGDKDWKCKHIIAVEMYLENRGPTNGDSRYDIIDLK